MSVFPLCQELPGRTDSGWSPPLPLGKHQKLVLAPWSLSLARDAQPGATPLSLCSPVLPLEMCAHPSLPSSPTRATPGLGWFGGLRCVPAVWEQPDVLCSQKCPQGKVLLECLPETSLSPARWDGRTQISSSPLAPSLSLCFPAGLHIKMSTRSSSSTSPSSSSLSPSPVGSSSTPGESGLVLGRDLLPALLSHPGISRSEQEMLLKHPEVGLPLWLRGHGGRWGAGPFPWGWVSHGLSPCLCPQHGPPQPALCDTG